MSPIAVHQVAAGAAVGKDHHGPPGSAAGGLVRHGAYGVQEVGAPGHEKEGLFALFRGWDRFSPAGGRSGRGTWMNS